MNDNINEAIVEKDVLSPETVEIEAEIPEAVEAPAEIPASLPPVPDEQPDVEVVGVRFKVGGKIYFFDPQDLQIATGEDVIIETSRGMEYGQCAQGNHKVSAAKVVQPLRPVLRVATEKDAETLEANRKKEKKAFEVCQQKIIEHKLDMKLIEVEYSFDGSKILFFFTSDGRVDFRELVKNLASVFRTRIELRQIGVRDEAKMLGGLGICGRPFCCSSFLDDFHPVSIKMAKTQNLSLNPTKISGCCGRLMCCLKYEQDAYEDMVKRTPKVESYVETAQGNGVVTEASLLKATVKVVLDNEPDTVHVYRTNEITVLHNGPRTKKSAPLLPPDPPVVYEEIEESKSEYPEIIYSDSRMMEKTPQQTAPSESQDAQEDTKKRSRRNRNRKKPAEDASKQETAAPRKQDKPAAEGQKQVSRRQNQKPKTPKPAAEGQATAEKPAQQRQQRPKKSANQQKQEPKAEAKPETKPALPKAEGQATAEKPKSKNRGRYYRNRRSGGQKPGGEGKTE